MERLLMAVVISCFVAAAYLFMSPKPKKKVKKLKQAAAIEKVEQTPTSATAVSVAVQAGDVTDKKLSDFSEEEQKALLDDLNELKADEPTLPADSDDSPRVIDVSDERSLFDFLNFLEIDSTEATVNEVKDYESLTPEEKARFEEEQNEQPINSEEQNESK